MYHIHGYVSIMFSSTKLGTDDKKASNEEKRPVALGALPPIRKAPNSSSSSTKLDDAKQAISLAKSSTGLSPLSSCEPPPEKK